MQVFRCREQRSHQLQSCHAQLEHSSTCGAGSYPQLVGYSVHDLSLSLKVELQAHLQPKV